MNPFAEKYKTLSNADLLKIIDNPSDYQPFAVEAAESELNQRELTTSELEEANAENEAKKQHLREQIDRKVAFETKVKGIGFSIADTINPIQKTPPSANRIIAILSIGFGVLFLYEIFNQLEYLEFILTDKFVSWDLKILLYLLNLIVLPLAVFLFWRRKKSGWVFFSILFTFSLLAALYSLTLLLKLNRVDNRVNDLLPVASPASILWNVLFFAGCLWLIYKNDIRVIYAIDKRAIIISTLIGIVLTVLMGAT